MAWSSSKMCLPQMKACASRACKLNADGTTKIGTTSALVSDALVSLGITPVYKAGTEISETDACGTTFVDVLGAPALVRYDIDIDVWSTNPNFLSIVLPDGEQLVGAGGQIGFGYPAPGPVTGQFSFEFWQQIINSNNLDPDFPYAQWALPLLKNVQLQKRDVTGNGVSHTVLKAEAYVNTNWFDGPGGDWGVASDKPVLWLPKAALPTIQCDPVAITS